MWRKSLIVALNALLMHSYGYAQLEIGVSGGLTSMLGDFGGGIGRGTILVKDVDIRSLEAGWGGLAKVHFHRRINLRFHFIQSRLHADDNNSGNLGRFERGLRTDGPLTEASVMLEGDLFPLNYCLPKTQFTPYAGVGLGGYRVDPTLAHRNLPLDQLETEQPFIQPEGIRQGMMIPFSFGMKYKVGKNWIFAAEVLYRYTFQDDLDLYIRQQNDHYIMLGITTSYTICTVPLSFHKLWRKVQPCPRP